MRDFVTALGLLLIAEGALYALLPGGMRQAMQRLLAEPDARLRQFGLIAAAGGLTLVWLGQRLLG